MTNLMDIIKGRRSVRSYQDKAISEEDLNQILESVKWSPSWSNTQCWEIVIIRDPNIKSNLKNILPEPSTNPAAKHFAEAPVILALCAKLATSGYYKGEASTKFGDWMMYDLGIATQSICLSAYDLGIGTVVVGLFDHDRMAKELGVSEGYELVTLIPLGYPTKESKAPKRREVGEFVHYDRF